MPRLARKLVIVFVLVQGEFNYVQVYVMAASISDVSNPSSLARLFDLETLQELIIMRDMMQEMNEDRKENAILQEELMAMKEEKKELLEKMHEMEIQLLMPREPWPSMCMKMRYAIQVYLQFPLKMNVLVFWKDALEE